MKCPFRIKEISVIEGSYNDPVPANKHVKYRDFDSCYGDECPFYYQDEDGVSKCSRCNPTIEEEI